MTFLLVIADGKGGHFDGERLFWKLAASCGLERWRCFVESDTRSLQGSSGGGNPTTPSFTNVSVLLCLGSPAFRRTTGIKTSIDNARGYLFTPSDCCEVESTRTGQIGVNKTSRFRRNALGEKEIVHAKGEPRLGKITDRSIPFLPPNVKWIIPTLDPVSVQEAGFRTLPALKADLLRAVRFLEGKDSPLKCSFLEYPIGTDSKSIAIDIETSGKSWSVERIGVSDGTATFSSHWNA